MVILLFRYVEGHVHGDFLLKHMKKIVMCILLMKIAISILKYMIIKKLLQSYTSLEGIYIQQHFMIESLHQEGILVAVALLEGHLQYLTILAVALQVEVHIEHVLLVEVLVHVQVVMALVENGVIRDIIREVVRDLG